MKDLFMSEEREPGAKDEYELTILMPCLNEAETLGVCIDKAKRYLARSGVAGEVLIADNGRTDGNQEIARTKGARVVAVSERGYGSPPRCIRPCSGGMPTG